MNSILLPCGFELGLSGWLVIPEKDQPHLASIKSYEIYKLHIVNTAYSDATSRSFVTS